jgi:hypothetical protein
MLAVFLTVRIFLSIFLHFGLSEFVHGSRKNDPLAVGCWPLGYNYKSGYCKRRRLVIFMKILISDNLTFGFLCETDM